MLMRGMTLCSYPYPPWGRGKIIRKVYWRVVPPVPPSVPSVYILRPIVSLRDSLPAYIPL